MVYLFFYSLYSSIVYNAITKSFYKPIIFDSLPDFARYSCKNKIRIGGRKNYVSNAINPLWRIDEAWFVCYDTGLAPVKDNCNVLSFGISYDETFDAEINEKYGCMVHSFDPFSEANRFTKIRDSSPSLKESYMIKVNDKWNFYRIGLVGFKEKISNQK